MSNYDALLENSKSLISDYIQEYPAEVFGMHHLLRQIATQGSQVFDRKNMDGHITASVLVISDDHESALLIHHKAYDTWIPPGGHMEPGTTTLLQSAVRELLEETGLVTSKTSATLLDIDTHAIASRPEKNEGPHWHHDFMFVMTAPAGFEPVHQESEVHGVAWVPFAGLKNDLVARNRRLHAKATNLLEGFGGLD